METIFGSLVKFTREQMGKLLWCKSNMHYKERRGKKKNEGGEKNGGKGEKCVG